jgi:hypothetical protein
MFFLLKLYNKIIFFNIYLYKYIFYIDTTKFLCWYSDLIQIDKIIFSGLT